MHTLPVTPVESLAIPTRTMRSANPGIVPPWLLTQHAPGANGNPGIVPPWLVAGAPTPESYAPLPTQPPESEVVVRNPGIVPPWLLTTVVGPTRPIGADNPHIVRAAAQAVAH